MVTIPNVAASGQTINAADYNANFNALAAAASNLTNSALAANAGITSDRLADRYAIYQVLVPLVAETSGANLGAIVEFSVPNADTILWRHRTTLRSGQEAYLCEVEFYVHNITVAVTAFPTISVSVAGTVLGGAATTANADASYFRLRNANPIDNPLIALADTNEFAYTFGRSDGSGTPTIAGVLARLTFKIRLSS